MPMQMNRFSWWYFCFVFVVVSEFHNITQIIETYDKICRFFYVLCASLLAMDIYHKLCIQLKWNTFTVSIGFFCIHTVYTFPWMPIKPLIIDSVSSMHSIKLAFLVIEAHCTNTHTHTHLVGLLFARYYLNCTEMAHHETTQREYTQDTGWQINWRFYRSVRIARARNWQWATQQTKNKHWPYTDIGEQLKAKRFWKKCFVSVILLLLLFGGGVRRATKWVFQFGYIHMWLYPSEYLTGAFWNFLGCECLPGVLLFLFLVCVPALLLRSFVVLACVLFLFLISSGYCSGVSGPRTFQPAVSFFAIS